MKITFNEISVKGVRRWKTPDGKNRQETKKFFQTFNPWNKDSQGRPKSRDQIVAEIQAERDAWEVEARPQQER